MAHAGPLYKKLFEQTPSTVVHYDILHVDLSRASRQPETQHSTHFLKTNQVDSSSQLPKDTATRHPHQKEKPVVYPVANFRDVDILLCVLL